MKLIVFSICKDEAETIGRVLDGIPKKIPGITNIKKLVISDGSTDDTALVARRHGAQVLEGIEQKRLAYRFQEAVAMTLDEGADVVVNIDGDLQFNPADIPKLLQPILKEGYDFVAADRFSDGKTGKRIRPHNMPMNKYLANRIGSWIVGSLSKHNFRDVTCGFRAYNRKALIALNINSRYTYTQESFQVLAMKGLNIKAVPVPVKYYPGRHSRVVTSFVGFLFSSAINIMRAYRDFAPLRFFGWLGFWFFALGLIAVGFLGVHWLQTSEFTPYKFVGFIGIYLLTLGLVFWALGLVADMFSRSLNNQEKILEKLKELKWKDK